MSLEDTDGSTTTGGKDNEAQIVVPDLATRLANPPQTTAKKYLPSRPSPAPLSNGDLTPPTKETSRPLVRQSPACPQPAARVVPRDNTTATEEVPLIPDPLPPASPPPPSSSSPKTGGLRVCRDPRLVNISPTSADGRAGVIVPTGYGSTPYRQGLNYSTDN